MNIKTFLETAGNFDERDILTKAHRGLDIFIDTLPKIKYLETTDEEENTVIVEQPIQLPVNQLDISNNFNSCDVAVFLGSWKSRDRPHHLLRTTIAENARCFVVIETPLLNRKMFEKNKQHRMGVNGYLNHAGTFFQQDCPADRFEKLGISWPGWKFDPGGKIVVMLQLPGDASLRGINIYEWATHVVRQLRQHTDRPIVIRTHPAHMIKDSDEFHNFVSDLTVFQPVENVSFSIGKKVPLNLDLDSAYCTITYSSGSGIDSIINGIPTIATDPGNFAWEISTHYIDQVENIVTADAKTVLQWLYNLAYSQWSVEEIADGTAWAHLWPIILNTLESNVKRREKR